MFPLVAAMHRAEHHHKRNVESCTLRTAALMVILISPNSTWLDSTRLDTFDFVELCFSNMADDEEAVVLACTSFVCFALSVHVNKTEKRRHAVWVKYYLKKKTLLDATILF